YLWCLALFYFTVYAVFCLFDSFFSIIFFFSVQIIVLFFSSRRRHTRSKRDWSSDVCSSDLDGSICSDSIRVDQQPHHSRYERLRSEERRVGKECSSPWWLCEYNKSKCGAVVEAQVHKMQGSLRASGRTQRCDPGTLRLQKLH